jgi:hypothetical protein
MGDIIGRIYDDFEEYEALCKATGTVSVGLGGAKSFYTHEDEILAQWNVKSKYEFWEKFNESKSDSNSGWGHITL